MRNYVPIDTSDLPDIFDITLAGDVFTFRVDYNAITDYYLLTIWDADGNLLLAQEPLLLNQLVGIDLQDSRLPAVDLRTMDESNQAPDAGQGEFGDNVKLYLDIVDPNGSEDKDPSIEPMGYDPETDNADNMTNEEVSF